MSKPSAVLVGATGLVGESLLKLILSSDYYGKITVITRKPLDVDSPILKNVVLEEFYELVKYGDLFDANHIYCCLGMAYRKNSDQELFRRINLDFPLIMAKLARDQPNFQSFHIVTSVGASSNPVLYYNTVKGQVEKGLTRLRLPALKIYRPSLVIGKRRPIRLKEEIGKVACFVLSFFMIGSSQKSYIRSTTIAHAMFLTARKNEPGRQVFLPGDMERLSYYDSGNY